MTLKTARIASVSFSVQGIASEREFNERITRHIMFGSDCGADLIVFPEYLTAPLLAFKNDWAEWTQSYLSLFKELSQTKNIDILAGTHICQSEDSKKVGRLGLNTAHYFSSDGSLHTQDKWHLTPFEKTGPLPLLQGKTRTLIDTKFGKVGIAICYDVEFPEFVRSFALAGADLVLVPSCTDDQHGFWRVRHCAAARCIENQIAVIHAPLVGVADRLRYFEQGYGKASVLVPCDIPFSPKGIAAEGEWNQDLCIVADVNIEKLRQIRSEGSVRPMQDLRMSDYWN